MKKIILSLVILSLVIPVSAQLNFTNYAHQNEIRSLVEEGNYIWIGTTGGILKRNKSTGSLVAKYTMKDGLVYNEVNSIAIDHLGNKWIGTAHGVSFFDGTSWTSYYQEDGLKTNSVGDIIIDLEGNVWFGTGNGVSKFDGTSWTSWTMSSTWNLAMDPNGTIWATANTGIVKIEDGILSQFTESNSDIADNTTSCIASDNDGNIYIGHSWDDTISVFDGVNWSYIAGLPTYIYDITVDLFGNKWVSHCCGIYAVNVYNNTNTLTDQLLGSDLINKFVRDILIDDQGNKWFGTDGGLTRYDDVNYASFSIPSDLSENDIMGIDIHPDNSTWFGTMNGIYILDEDNWSQHEDLDLVNNETYDIWIEDANNIWAGTSTGAAYYNGSTWTGYTNSNTSGGLANDHVYTVAIDKNQVIWCGTHSGLSLTQNGSDWDQLLPGVWIHDIIIDNEDNVWVSTHGSGIYKFTILTLADYPPSSENFTTTDGLLTNNVYSLACDQENNIWIGFQNNGIAVYDGINIDPISPVGVSFYNSINAITVDSLNNIWFAGDYRGILKFDGSNWVVYDGSNGLINDNTNTIIYNTTQQSIFVGTDVGISKINCVVPDPGFEYSIACHPQATSFDNISGDVDAATKYEWDIGDNGSVEYTTKNITHAFPSHGNYSVKLTVINDHCSASTTEIVNVNSMPQASVEPMGSTTICDGTSVTLKADIANYDGSLEYTYLWNTGATTSSIAASEPGTYSVAISHEECTDISDAENVTVKYPYNNERICMVSVDEETNKNMIIWDKTPNEGIAAYNIYKLFGSSYTIVGQVPYDALSVFVDHSSNPEAVAARYAITVVDTCGNESDLSPYHQTIHLGASEGALPEQIELDWTEYLDEAGGFSYDYFYIYRGTSIGSLELYDSVSSAFTAYTDIDAQGNIYYRVGVKSPALCVPTGSLKAGAGPYSHSLSNLEDNRLQTAANESPTDISIDDNTIDEELPISTLVGRLITSDPDADDQHTYTLVSGDGDIDNESFIIVSNLLLSAEEFDYETKSSYSVRIRTTDDGTDNLYYEEVFTITIIDQIDVGVKDLAHGTFLVYPNPFKDATILEFPNPDKEEFRLTIMDLTGKVVRLTDNITTGRYEFQRDDLPAGYYFIELRGSKVYHGRMIIE